MDPRRPRLPIKVFDNGGDDGTYDTDFGSGFRFVLGKKGLVNAS